MKENTVNSTAYPQTKKEQNFLEKHLALPLPITGCIEGVCKYLENSRSRMVQQVVAKTQGQKLKNTHDGIDLKSYLEYLHVRHLAIRPYVSEIYGLGASRRGFDCVVDLGGGPGTLIELCIQEGMAKSGILVDRRETVDEVKKHPVLSKFRKSTLDGTLTAPYTWAYLRDHLKGQKVLWVLSDVLHGRNDLDLEYILKEFMKCSGVKIIREFGGFDAKDNAFFDQRLRLLSDGKWRSKKEMIKKIQKMLGKNFYYVGKVVTPYYYIIQLLEVVESNDAYKV